MNNIDKNAQKFADLMVSKIEEINVNWKKPWFSKKITYSNFLPQNINGRTYASGNAFFLLLLTEKENFQTPVFLTFKQAKELNVSILKGSETFPVYYNLINAIHRVTEEKITIEQYRDLSEEEQSEYKIIKNTKYYLVFNLDQTNYSETYPARWAELEAKFNHQAPYPSEEEVKMYCNPFLDTMLKDNSWVCPIILKKSDRAFFSPSNDKIEMPLKSQFVDGEAFYSTQLHEMSHSTGLASRLNRTDFTKGKDSKAYGREELVAEFSAALSGVIMGVSSSIREENAAYLKGWINNIKEEPKFLMSVLSDSIRVVKFITNQLGVTFIEMQENTPEAVQAA